MNAKCPDCGSFCTDKINGMDWKCAICHAQFIPTSRMKKYLQIGKLMNDLSKKGTK